MTSLEEQIEVYRELVQQIAVLEEQKRELNQIISQQMSEKTMTIGKCIVRRYHRFSFKTPIEKARELGATKTEEVLDKKMLKKIHESGQPVPGVTTFTYIQVSLQKEPQAAEDIANLQR